MRHETVVTIYFHAVVVHCALSTLFNGSFFTPYGLIIIIIIIIIDWRAIVTNELEVILKQIS